VSVASPGKKLDLLLLWHMHQPDMRDAASGEFTMPWVYLHSTKDYLDMAAHFERHPKMRGVVNFVPVLLDQIEDYVAQFERGEVRDPLLRLLPREDLQTLDPHERQLIIDRCFRANHVKMVEPYAPYKRLAELYRLVRDAGADPARYLSSEYLGDLLTWYHLSWTGETVRRNHKLVVELMSKGQLFSAADRRGLFDLIGSLIGEIIPRYRRLAQSGQIELSTTPHYHPIGPLMLDLRSAREAQPDLPLPEFDQYPGWRGRLGWHIQSAIDTHTRRFGAPPRGMWPAEGAISASFLQTLADAGIEWAASGEAVLAHSLSRANSQLPPRESYLYRGYRTGARERQITCLFRDDRLSDMIGFEYSKWHGRDAVSHLMGELDRIRLEAAEGETPLVSIMLDGENAWESYPYNGYYFLDEFYEAVEQHASIRTVTGADCVDALKALPTGSLEAGAPKLDEIVAGSWVYGNLSTWIGAPEKNLAWNLLCSAKQSYDLVIASGRLSAEETALAQKQLAACEGSDWFWWFGDYNPQESVDSFDLMFRTMLSRLYATLHLPAPDRLRRPISVGGGRAELGGAMRRAS
jgi:alpha-amylase/alpha-mannosidase (GH57 family)